MLRSYFQIEACDTAEMIIRKVTDKLLLLDHAIEAFLSPLLFLLDILPKDPRWEQMDPPHRRVRILEAVKALLLRQSQLGPVFVIVENLHWIDSETQAVLDTLVDNLPLSRILLFVNYRPEYEHRWGGKTYYTQIRLDPLPAESAGALLDSLLAGDQSLDGRAGALLPMSVDRERRAPRTSTRPCLQPH